MEPAHRSISDDIRSLMHAAEVKPLVDEMSKAAEVGCYVARAASPLGKLDAIRLEELKRWLTRALHVALRIEMTVIPAYLVAMWTIKTATHARSFLADVAREEMIHMGLVCNTLAALGEDPPVTSPVVVPSYPTRLPALIRPDLRIELRSFSIELVRDVFVPIEAPSSAMYQWHEGQRYWTVGAFYHLLELALRAAPASLYSSRNQVEIVESDPPFTLSAVTTPTEAGDAMRLIRVQGEGTPGPLFGTDPYDDIAHYFRFWEIIKGRRIRVKPDGSWSFTGDPVSCPGVKDVHQIARPADPDLPEARRFDNAYGNMLTAFEAAWRIGMQPPLEQALEAMLQLPGLAFELFEATTDPFTGECHGPSFML